MHGNRVRFIFQIRHSIINPGTLQRQGMPCFCILAKGFVGMKFLIMYLPAFGKKFFGFFISDLA